MIGNRRNARILRLKRERLDKLVHERGLVESLDLARRYIMAGQVRVGGARMDKPGAMVDIAACVEVVEGRRFVSRGGVKLDGALSEMGLAVEGLVCADVGASTGGFTDCLLQRGALRVYAVDVGKGLLHWKLRNDARVVVVEETNARFLSVLPEVVDLIVVDAAFISLQQLLAVVAGWLNPVGGRMLALVKPQFEAERGQVERGGVVRDPAVHRQVLLAAGVSVATHQVQYSVLDQRPAAGMTDLCATHGVQLLCYGALAGGFLAEKYLGQPAPVEPLENRSLVKYRLIIEEFGGWDMFQNMLQVLRRIAAKHQSTISAVAIRHVLDQPQVAGVIVGARNAQHLPATLAAMRLRLDAADRTEIAAGQAAASGPGGDTYTLERMPRGPHAAIMRYNINANS